MTAPTDLHAAGQQEEQPQSVLGHSTTHAGDVGAPELVTAATAQPAPVRHGVPKAAELKAERDAAYVALAATSKPTSTDERKSELQRLLDRYDTATHNLTRAYSDPYADAADRRDAQATLDNTRDALLDACLAAHPEQQPGQQSKRGKYCNVCDTIQPLSGQQSIQEHSVARSGDVGAPDTLWLQVDQESPSVDDSTWCRDKINDTDVRYVRADLSGASDVPGAKGSNHPSGLTVLNALEVLDRMDYKPGDHVLVENFLRILGEREMWVISNPLSAAPQVVAPAGVQGTRIAEPQPGHPTHEVCNDCGAIEANGEAHSGTCGAAGVKVDAPAVTITADLAQRLVERLEFPGPSWIEHRASLAAELRAAAGVKVDAPALPSCVYRTGCQEPTKCAEAGQCSAPFAEGLRKLTAGVAMPAAVSTPYQFWLIERGPNQGVPQHQWWNEGPDGRVMGWKLSVHEATRYPSKEAAEQVVRANRGLRDLPTAVTSHGFVEPAGVSATHGETVARDTPMGAPDTQQKEQP